MLNYAANVAEVIRWHLEAWIVRVELLPEHN